MTAAFFINETTYQITINRKSIQTNDSKKQVGAK